jgi:type VI secretion system secreted protein VgrG
MSILDDAIREHLELKRAHGADDSELKKLEDEAFGPPQRPDEIDPLAEAPTEFLATPEGIPADAPDFGDEAAPAGRRPDIADLQEAPPAPSDADPAQMPPPEDELSPTPDAPPPSPIDAADVPLPPPPGEAPAANLAPPTDEGTGAFFDQFSTPPADAPAPSGEAAAPLTDETPIPSGESATDEAPSQTDEAAIPSGDAPTAPSDVVDAAAPPTDESPVPTDESPLPGADVTDEASAPLTDAGAPTDEAPAADHAEERDAIVDQPTQMFDVQAHVDAEAAAEAPATGEQASPTDEELVDAAAEEPHAAPPAPDDSGPPTEMYEQPQLNVRGPDAEVAGHPPADAEEGSAEFDFFNEQRLSDELDQALEAPLPPTEEHLAMPQYKDAPPEQSGIFDFQGGGEGGGETYEEDPSQEVLRRADEAEAAEEPLEDDEADTDYDPETGHEDVLEDTPRFLEDSPDDDDLWFEQKPPKDFDLD